MVRTGRVRNLGVHDLAYPAPDRRLREWERRVDARLDLRRRAGKVDRDAVTLDDHTEVYDDVAGLDVVAVYVVREVVDAVREFGDFLPNTPLGVLEQGIHVPAHPRRAVASYEIEELALAKSRSRDLRANVAQHLVGNPDVGREQVEHRLVGDAPLIELGGRNPQALLVYLVGVCGVAAGHEAADVCLVGDRAGEPLHLILGEDRLDDVHVRQVNAA